jgi:hypothetical protein
MGSRGTSQYTDYTKMKSSDAGGNGGSSGTDPCEVDIESALDDVARANYYAKHSAVPEPGSIIHVVFTGGRLEVQSIDNVTIGYLPTQYNFLALCINQGIEYGGGVITSRTAPIPDVRVSIRKR